jgi:RNA polymerase sigma factor (sigma-70 family)
MDLLSARRAAAEEPATIAVTDLYAEHALGLTRLAQVMLGDRGAAEDVVHDAFCGLYRHWSHLADTAKAPSYLRSSVLNGCRSVLRRAGRAPVLDVRDATVPDSESAVLASLARQEVLAALRRLPDRQREALVLRYYLDLRDSEIATAMGVREGSVRSAAHRGLAALERILGEEWL